MVLPIYNAIISDEEDGVYAVSLVDCPATEINWVAFSKDSKLEFSVDETKHCLTAPLMVADTLIYRRNGDYEYYIKYEPETLRIMAEKMLADNTFNEIDFQHDGKIIEHGKVNLLELYIKDESKPSPFDVPDGSIICTYKINDDEIWEAATNGTFNGFSLAGFFNIEEVKCSADKNINETKKLTQKFMDILNTLKNLIVEIEAEKYEEQNTEVVAEETVEVVAEEQPADESTEEPEQTPDEEPQDNAELDAIKESIAALENAMAKITGRIEAIENALKETAETPVEEQPAEVEEDKYARLGKLFKK